MPRTRLEKFGVHIASFWQGLGFGMAGLAAPFAAAADSRPVISLHCAIAVDAQNSAILPDQAQLLCDQAMQAAQSLAPQYQFLAAGDVLPSIHVTVTKAGAHSAALAGYWRDDTGAQHALAPLASTLYDSNATQRLHSGLLRAFLQQLPLFSAPH